MSFIDYTGICEYDPLPNLYRFEMKNEILEEANYIEIADLTIDNTFKHIFLGDKKITESCLNSLLFPGEDRIIDITFLPSENPEEGPYRRGSIRLAILCECNLKKTENKNQHYNNDLQLIVDFNIEKGLKNTNDERFIKYARTLFEKYIGKKILILVLIITPDFMNSFNLDKLSYPFLIKDLQSPSNVQNKGNEICFKKEPYENYKNVMFYDNVSIYQIDLNILLKLINDKKNIDILNGNYLQNKGMEWIKFITISKWCSSMTDGYYILPPLGKTIIEDEQILKAFKLLGSKSIGYMKNRIDQNILLKEIKENNELVEKLTQENDEYKREIKIMKEQNQKILEEKKYEPMDIITEDEDDLHKKNNKKIIKVKFTKPKDQ